MASSASEVLIMKKKSNSRHREQSGGAWQAMFGNTTSKGPADDHEKDHGPRNQLLNCHGATERAAFLPLVLAKRGLLTVAAVCVPAASGPSWNLL